MNARQAFAFIRKHGVVLEAARGEVPSLAEAIAGEPIGGTWWAHPKSHEIFALTRTVREWEDVLVCRLVSGKITFVHRRLWPALVRLAGRLSREHLAKVREVHTGSGRHRTEVTRYPRWVPSEVRAAARRMSEEVALSQFGQGVLQRELGRPNKDLQPTAAGGRMSRRG